MGITRIVKVECDDCGRREDWPWGYAEACGWKRVGDEVYCPACVEKRGLGPKAYIGKADPDELPPMI